MSLEWADLSHDVVLVEGDDAGVFLHSQLANDVSSIPVGDSVHSLLLEPTGHVHSLVRVVRHGDLRYTIDVAAGFGADVVQRLRRYVLRARLSMELVDWGVRAFRGDDAGEVLADVPGTAIVAWGDASGQAGDVVAPTGTLPGNGEPVAPARVHEHDTDLRWPRFGIDLLAGDIPATSGILSVAVSFTKGCYPGQELVERMDSRGTSAPIVLRALPREGRVPGDAIFVDGVEVGTVTSVGRHVALARVARGSRVGEPLG